LNTFDRHLLREWLGILGLVVIALTGLLIAQILYDDFQHLREWGAGLAEMGFYLMVVYPGFLSLVLPLSLLLSLLFVLSQLHRTNEFTAMRAAGVGFLRLTRPVWLVGLVACGLMWLLNSSVVPWSIERSRSMREEIEFRGELQAGAAERAGQVTGMAFDNREAHRMWFFNQYSRALQRGFGVTLSESDADGNELIRWRANEARPLPGGGWRFIDGTRAIFDPSSGVMEGLEPFAEITRADFAEDPSLMLLIEREPDDLSFFELGRLLRYFEAAGNSGSTAAYTVRYFGILADTLSPLIVIAIAIPFAVAGVRVNPAVGVSKSIGLFFLYYILINLASSLAIKGLVPPETAAWLPHACVAVLAGWFFIRLR